MKVTLKKLCLRNFKGIDKFTFEPGGNDATLYGDNGAGKSRCSDAYAWLLTDSDSNDNNDFYIKEFDGLGIAKTGVEASVAGCFDIDGEEELSLKKTLKETFTGKGVDKVFDGHKTIREINGLSVSKQKYQAKLEGFAPKEVFKSLLNPAYFGNQKTEAKRELILGLINNVSQEDVVSSDKKLKTLPETIKPHSPSDYKAIAAKQKTKLKEQIKEIPAVIKGVMLGLPTVDGLKKTRIESDIKTWEVKKDAAEKELFQLKNGGAVGEKKQLLAETKAERLTLETAFSILQNKKVTAEIQKKNQALAEEKEIDLGLSSIIKEVTGCSSQITVTKEGMADLREEWKKVKAEEYDVPLEICYACGEKIPEAKYENFKKKGLEKFNTEKAKNLKQINASGLKLRDEKDNFEKLLKELQKKDKELKKDKKLKKAEILAAELMVKTVAKETLESPEYKKVLKKEEDCTSEIASIEAGDISEQVLALEAKIDVVSSNIKGLGITLKKFETIAESEVRIKELNEDRKVLSKEFETLERNVSMVDLYTKKWVEMVEGPVNTLFEITTFNMFEEQVNGGLKDVCMAMFDGVPYDRALNKGHRKMIGADIIKTFSKYYNCWMPIFVDDAEGVTVLPEMDTQILKLIKPEITDNNREYYSKLQNKPFKEA